MRGGDQVFKGRPAQRFEETEARSRHADERELHGEGPGKEQDPEPEQRGPASEFRNASLLLILTISVSQCPV